MESLYLLIPLSVLLAFIIGLVFWWASKDGQFDDMEGPAWRILQDDDRGIPRKSNENEKNHPD
ncbi:MAG: cbb3-type cytochrome oxidase assembly protein CcoS [Formivibrio sp.]|nr:cbb3-type cytochrome oxidase assembly protein CcoS [Formivibrio sp.]